MEDAIPNPGNSCVKYHIGEISDVIIHWRSSNQQRVQAVLTHIYGYRNQNDRAYRNDMFPKQILIRNIPKS